MFLKDIDKFLSVYHEVAEGGPGAVWVFCASELFESCKTPGDFFWFGIACEGLAVHENETFLGGVGRVENVMSPFGRLLVDEGVIEECERLRGDGGDGALSEGLGGGGEIKGA